MRDDDRLFFLQTEQVDVPLVMEALVFVAMIVACFFMILGGH